MDKIQKRIINELRAKTRKLGKSSVRRNFSSGFNSKCIKYFGSFNKAKLKAGLSISQKNRPIPRRDLRLDKRLTRIVSHLTFDGHLDKKLKMFHFSSNSREELERLRDDVHKKFNLDVFKVRKGNGYGTNVLTYWYFNANLCKFLHSVGTPKGNKVITKFDVPEWIKSNKELAKEYLKMAYLCEGSKYKKSKTKDAIKINLNKSVDLLESGLTFMNSLKDLLTLPQEIRLL